MIYEKYMEKNSIYEVFKHIRKNFMDNERIFICGIDYQFTLVDKDELTEFITEKLSSVESKIICITIELLYIDNKVAESISDKIKLLKYSSNVSFSRNGRYIDMVYKGISKKTAVEIIIKNMDI